MADDLCALLELSGPVEDVITRAGKLVKNDRMAQALEELAGLCRQLPPETEIITLDLSLAGDMEYYNGLVFQGYLSGLSSPVLKGGRYDPLAEQFRPGARAVGQEILKPVFESPSFLIVDKPEGVACSANVFANDYHVYRAVKHL